jgi:peptidoglycan hydrolase-like protein with peptidoglycan-binding domain
MPLTLAELRDNLDGLGYYLGPRGLFGVGNENQSCDRDILGNIDCSSTSLREINQLEAYTQAAIFQFQTDNLMAATGQNGANLQNKVEESVRILQNNLKIVLGNSLPITGRYLFQTIAAVKTYQQNRRFPVTGIASRPVRKQLDDDARKLVGKPPGTTPSPTPTPTPTPVPSTELDNLRKLRTDLATLKDLHQRRTLTDEAFITAVYRLLP